MKKITLLAAFLSCALVLSPSVHAGGFMAVEQNASGLGVAYAGAAASADNAGTLYYNPAGLTQLPGAQLSVGLVGAQSRYEFDDDGSVGLVGGEGGQAGQWRGLPHVYASWAVNADWSLGLGVSSPYSLDTEYDDDWLGRNTGVSARLSSLNINPALAYRISDRVSVGLGLNYQQIRLKTALNAMRDSDTDSAWGWNVGALFTLSPEMRLGLAYRSGMDYRLDANASALQAFPGVDGRGRFKTPDVFSLSVWQQVSERWEAMGDISWANWDRVEGYDHDSWRLSWGAAYTYNEHWKSKFGIAYDRSPIRTAERGVLLADAHRLWLAIGGQYRFGKYATLDFGYAYQRAREARLDQAQGAGLRLKGNYDASGHVIGVQYNQGF
ncbi:MAG: OmpP1/FadL family transporter [Zoogloeaceae bacterium]|jgi:long-chain fatty acid transport protein|nr:OmpP1/FadL family transporter [Zoogloeaceae bacterium]